MAVNGPVPKTRSEGRGPTIWLAGTPDESGAVDAARHYRNCHQYRRA